MANPFNIPPTSTSNISTRTYSSSSPVHTLAGNPIITSTHSTPPTFHQNTYGTSQSGHASQAGYATSQASYGYSTPQAAGYAAEQAVGYAAPQAVGYAYSDLQRGSAGSMGSNIETSVMEYLRGIEISLTSMAPSRLFNEDSFNALSKSITISMTGIDGLQKQACTNSQQPAYKHTEVLKLIQAQQQLLNTATQFLHKAHNTLKKSSNIYIQSSITPISNLTASLSHNIYTQIQNEIISSGTRKGATDTEELKKLERTINNVKGTALNLANLIRNQHHQTFTTAKSSASLQSTAEDLDSLLALLYPIKDDSGQNDEEQGNKGQENKGKRRADPSVDMRSMDSRSFSVNPSDRGPTFNPSSVNSVFNSSIHGSIHAKADAGSAGIVEDPLQPSVIEEFSSLGISINNTIRSLSDMTQNINPPNCYHTQRTIRHGRSINPIVQSIQNSEASPELIVQALCDLIALLPHIPNYKISPTTTKIRIHKGIENCRSFTIALCNSFCSQIKRGREKLAQGYTDQGFISRLDKIQTAGLSVINSLSQMHQIRYGNSGIPFFSDENNKNLNQIITSLMEEIGNDSSLTSTPRDKSVLTDTIMLIASKNDASDLLAKGTHIANEIIDSLLTITTLHNIPLFTGLAKQILTFINCNEKDHVAPQVIAHTFQQLATLAPYLDKYDATKLSSKNGVLVLATQIENIAQAMADSFSKQSTILRDMTDRGLNPSVIQELDTLEQQIADAMKKLLLLNSPKNMRNAQLLSNNDIRNQLQKFIIDAEDKQMREISNYVTAHGSSIFSDLDLDLGLGLNL